MIGIRGFHQCIFSFQLTPSDRVCHVCWLRIKREALRTNIVDQIRLPEAMPQNEDENLQEDESHENPQPEPIARSNTENLVLPDYKRAANTGNHCVFSGCTNTGTLHSVSDQLRAIILSNHNYYIPKLARVCGDHLARNSWDSIQFRKFC